MENLSELSGAFVSLNPSVAALHSEADGIQRLMDQEANITDPAALVHRLNGLDAHMSRLTDMMIRAKAMREKAKWDYVDNNEERLNEMSATVSNRAIDSHLRDYTTLYNRLDAMYHTMEHLTRDLVTQISYIKKQMESFGG